MLWSGDRLSGEHGRKVWVRVEGCGDGKFRVKVDGLGFPEILDGRRDGKTEYAFTGIANPVSDDDARLVNEIMANADGPMYLRSRSADNKYLRPDGSYDIDKITDDMRKGVMVYDGNEKKRSDVPEFIARAHYDFDFLNWIYDRLVNVHGENKSYDYMHRLKKVIEDTRLRELKERENVDSNRPLTSEEQAEIDELEKQNEKNWDKLKEMIAEEAAKRERGPWPSPKGRELWIGAFLAGLEEGDLVAAADLADEVYRQYGEKHDGGVKCVAGDGKSCFASIFKS